MSIDSLTPRLAAGQRAVHEALVVEKVFEAGAEAGLVVVPFQAVLLSFTHTEETSTRRRGEISQDMRTPARPRWG